MMEEILEISSEPMIVFSRDGDVCFVNSTAKRWMVSERNGSYLYSVIQHWVHRSSNEKSINIPIYAF